LGFKTDPDLLPILHNEKYDNHERKVSYACLPFSKEQSSSWDYRQNILWLQNFKEFSKHILNNLPLEWKTPSKLCLFLLCALFPKVLESGTSAFRKTPPVVFHTAIFPS